MKPGEVRVITETVDRIVRLQKADDSNGGDWFKLEVFTRRSRGEQWVIKEVSLMLKEIDQIIRAASDR